MIRCLHVGFSVAIVLFCVTAFGANRVQVCASACKGASCKKLAEEIEFELEPLENFLILPCKKGALPSKEFRLKFSQSDSNQIEVELQCQSSKTCLRSTYATDLKRAALTTIVVNEVKTAIKHNKPFEVAKTTPPPEPSQRKSASTPALPVPHPAEEWDRVVVSIPQEQKPPALEPSLVEEVAPLPSKAVLRNKSMTVSLGAENWNYTFDSDQSSEHSVAIRNRIYPGFALDVNYWPWAFLQVSANGGYSIASLRLKANQPVDGDGQVISNHMTYAGLSVGSFYSLFGLIEAGLEIGYVFQGAFVDKQRVLQRNLTVVPSFQSHGISIGPRVIVGRHNSKFTLDIRAGLNPYTYYVESPDEPTRSKKLFGWTVRGVGRYMINADMYADAIASARVIHVHYVDQAIRENADGEKWGAGTVMNAASSFMAGVGWIF